MDAGINQMAPGPSASPGQASRTDPHAAGLLRELFEAGVEAARPGATLERHMPSPVRGRTVVVGAGKAAASMAAAFESRWEGALEGIVVTRYGHACPTSRIEVVEASHPVPDEAGMAAARRILAAVAGLRPEDQVVVLLSGGASALLTLPAPGLTLEHKREASRRLLRSGADIHEMNCVRRHLSAVKGGRLAMACHPARVVTLAISDVTGDEPASIGSGPTCPDPTTIAMARDIVRRHWADCPAEVTARLSNPENETPKPFDPRFDRCDWRLVASGAISLAAAERLARSRGYEVINLGDGVEGHSGAVAADQARLALEMKAAGRRACILSGGETTVTVRGSGRGGRNGEYLLALALALNGADGVHAIAGDTDGIDGSEDNAGAVVGPDTLARARALGLDAAAHLARNDSYTLFARLDDLVVTGPTLTNVNDFRAILVDP
jgi:hydroxypyruvate reductase